MKLTSPLIPENICGYLRAQIICGNLAGGQNINENSLAASLGVSRPPLREALKKLEEEHLIYSIPRKGSFVRELSIEDLDELYQARELIECGAIDFFEVKGIKNFPELDSFLSQSRELSFPPQIDSNTLLIYREKIADFHVKLVQQTGNFRITHFYQSLYFNLARYQYLYFSVSGSLERSRIEHECILADLKDGAYRRAKEHLMEHTRNARESQRDILIKKFKIAHLSNEKSK